MDGEAVMQKYLIIGLMFLMTTLLIAADIIPVSVWPKTIVTTDKVICNPTALQCVEAGYRLLADKPATPSGKRIVSQKIIQDPNDETKCIYEITYEDIPIVPPVVPEVLVIVPVTNVIFYATSNGVPRNWKLKTMPATNTVIIE